LYNITLQNIMTTQPPPTQYFNNIIFNPNFWNQTTAGITQAQADALYLARTGTPTSIASLTSFSGGITTNTTATVGTDLTLTNRNKLSSVKTVSGTTTLVSGDPEYINIVPTSSTAFTITLPRCDVSTKIGTKFSFFFTDASNFYPVITIQVNNTAIERIYDTYVSVTSLTISSSASVNAIELLCTAIKASSPSAVVWSTNTIATDFGLFAYVNVPNTFTDTNDFTATTTFTGGITGTGTQTIDFGTNAPTMAGTNVSGVVKTSGNESISGIKTFTGTVSAQTLTPTGRPSLSSIKTVSGATTLTFNDNENIVLAGSSAYTILLPLATTAGIGSKFTFSYFVGVTGAKTIQCQGTNFISDGQLGITTSSLSMLPSSMYFLQLLCTASSGNCWAVVARTFNPALSYVYSGTNTYNGSSSYTGGITASSTQTINFGTNAPTMAGTNVSGVVKTTGDESISGTKTFVDIVSNTINAITTLSIGGVSLYSIFLTTSNAINDYARLAYNNTFLGTTLFQYYIPTINSSLYPTTNYQLSPKIYVDDSFANVFGGSPKQFLNQISFTNYAPQTVVDPVSPLDLVNKGYIDNYVIGSSAVSNTWVSTNEFTTALRTSVSAVASTDVINKSYADSNLSNSALLTGTNTWSGTSNEFTTPLRTTVSAVSSTDVINKSYADSNLSNSALLTGTNTWSGTSNTFNGNFTANCPITTGSILLQYNGTTMIEISRYALYSPLSISADFSQITFNYAPVFRTSFYLDNNITMYVGSVYAPATLAIFDGTLSVSHTNGTFKTNTIEPTDTATNCTVYSTSTATVNVGNASASMVNTFANNTYNKITLNGRNNLFSIDTVRTTAFTISSPFFHIYPVNPTSNLVITLPTAGLSNLGTTFTIRRVGGTATTTITSASSNIYPFTSFTPNNSILVGNGYTTTIVCAYVNNTPTYGWFKIV
jgi:hypothetical protein